MLVIGEYIWLDANKVARSKTKVHHNDNSDNITGWPIWNFDGSSTGQADRSNSEVLLRPCVIFKDPFVENGYLILCDCLDSNSTPLVSNTRVIADITMEQARDQEPWFGLEQEYVLYDNNTKRPLGWKDKDQEPQGKYYCGVGADRSYGRAIVLEHFQACISAGVKICGINAEVMPSQWEFQIGPCLGIDAGDHLVIARYLLHRVCEQYNVTASFNPKPELGDWNGSGCHTNFSSKAMREDNGISSIHQAIAKLAQKHKEHLGLYGDNSKRLTGEHETSSPDKFTYGVADRGASVRIPLQVAKDRKGYLEDRRPAADCDPYLVTSAIVSTTLL